MRGLGGRDILGDRYIRGMEEKGGSGLQGCVCGRETKDEIKTCQRCSRAQHRGCIFQAFYMHYYECPQCQLEQVDPYQRVLRTLVPAALVQTQGSGVGPRCFTYSQEMHQMIAGDGQTIQIRSVRLDRQGFEQIWPLSCQVIVNGDTIYTASSDISQQHKGTMIAINGLEPGNSISVQVTRQRLDDAYAFGVFLVKSVSSEEVLSALIQENRVLTPDQGREFIQSIATSDVNSINFRLSLRCPLTQVLPKLPARGIDCKHVKCFDLEAFVVLQGTSRTKRWQCPICGLGVLRPVIDKYYEEIVQMAKLSHRHKSVDFLSNGNYQLLDGTPSSTLKRPRPAYPHPSSKRSKLTESNSRNLYGY